MSDKFNIKIARPIFRRALRLAPAHPVDDRILVRENKPESKSEGGVDIPEKEVQRCMHGALVAVGDTAADYLYDRGIELGDTVLYARYAGVVADWQHIVGKDDETCAHDTVWEMVGSPSDTLAALNPERQKDDAQKAKKWALVGGPNENIELRECRACGTLIAKERMIVMSCKDVLMSVELQERLESGEMARLRGTSDGTPDGETRHYIERRQLPASSFTVQTAPKLLKGVA